MTLNKYSFKSENLVVDYITFKFQYLDNLQQTIITKYLLKLGFNSYQQSGKLAQPIKESLRFSSKNQFEVSFVTDNAYWQGIGKVKNKFTFPIRSLIHLNIFSFVRKFFREKL